MEVKILRLNRVKLVTEMARQDITQLRLVELSGVSRATISGIQNGRSCSSRSAVKIADALKVPLEILLEDWCTGQHNKAHALPGKVLQTPDPGGRESNQRVNGAPACYQYIWWRTMNGITIQRQERRSGGLTEEGRPAQKWAGWPTGSGKCQGSRWYGNRYCALSALMVVYGQEQPCCRVADLYST